MLKQVGLIIIGLFLITLSYGQSLTFQTGISLSQLNWKTGSNNLFTDNKPLIGYSIFMGMNYFNRKYYNITSNFGFIRKGTIGEVSDINGGKYQNVNAQYTNIVKPKLDYFSFNTVIDVKYPLPNKMSPFVSIGPRIDYLLNYSKDFEWLKNKNSLKDISYGLIIGTGIKYELSKIEVGIRADYYLNFNDIAEWNPKDGNAGVNVKDNTFTINLLIVLKR